MRHGAGDELASTGAAGRSAVGPAATSGLEAGSTDRVVTKINRANRAVSRILPQYLKSDSSHALDAQFPKASRTSASETSNPLNPKGTLRQRP